MSMNQKRIRLMSRVAIVLAASLCMLFLLATEARAQSANYKRIYMSYAKQLQKKSSSRLYMAIVKSDQPVLLIAERVFRSSYYGNGNCAADAKIYQYVKNRKKVVYVGPVSSTGTGFPLRKSGKYIQRAYHHEACRIRVKNGKATGQEISNVFMPDNGKAEIRKATVKNGKWRFKYLKKVTQAKGGKIYAKYYSGKNSAIKFKAV